MCPYILGETPQFVQDTGTRVCFQTQHGRVLALPLKVKTVSSSVPSSDSKIAVRSAANSSIWELSALFTTAYLQIKSRQNSINLQPHIVVSNQARVGERALRICLSVANFTTLPLLHRLDSISSNVAVDRKRIKGWLGRVSDAKIKCHRRRPAPLTSISLYTAEETAL